MVLMKRYLWPNYVYIHFNLIKFNTNQQLNYESRYGPYIAVYQVYSVT